MDLFDWIQRELAPATCTTEALIYEHMDSQSGRQLPIIYQPFDPDNPTHWRDRGAALDFVCATRAEGGRVLDFGPGDGWPSLIVAPFVGEVVGVEGALKRVAVCERNAERLGITNATCEYVEPGAPLPFEEASFDAVVAASSVEQSPDPQATLEEFYRVLRPGGRLRMVYEALNRYREGQERELWVWAINEDRTRLILYDRDIEGETAVQVGLTFAMPKAALVAEVTGGAKDEIGMADLTVDALHNLRDRLTDAGTCTTYHPSGETLVRWLTEIGFRQVFPTHNGLDVSGRLFSQLDVDRRPADLDAIDAYLRPIVEVVVDLPAPVETDPMITAVR